MELQPLVTDDWRRMLRLYPFSVCVNNDGDFMVVFADDEERIWVSDGGWLSTNYPLTEGHAEKICDELGAVWKMIPGHDTPWVMVLDENDNYPAAVQTLEAARAALIDAAVSEGMQKLLAEDLPGGET